MAGSGVGSWPSGWHSSSSGRLSAELQVPPTCDDGPRRDDGVGRYDGLGRTRRSGRERRCAWPVAVRAGDADIASGSTVRWFNDDALLHAVTAANGASESGDLSPGGSFERRFDSADKYSHLRRDHHRTATIVVTAA